MSKIFVTRSVPDAALTILLNAFGDDAVTVYAEDQIIPRNELLDAVGDADGVLTMLTEVWNGETFSAAPNLKVLANCAVGYNNIHVDAANDADVTVTNTPDVLTETTADLAWALLLAAPRRVSEAESYLRAGKWDSWSPNFMLGNDVYGKTLGIYGMGRIGQATARRASGFRMDVIYHSRTRLSESEESQMGVRYVSFDELLEQSDFVSVHAPLLDETRGVFNADAFKKMKSTATLVNTSRGPLVDEAALAHALQTGEIAFAGIDVFEKEPTVHPDLLTCKNAVLLPHIGSATLETRTAMAVLAAENIVAVLNGKPPITPVNT
jgi:glyoxylate reductase